MKATWQQAISWRVAQQLLGQPGGTPVEVARRVAGVQAQVMSSAELAVGVRTDLGPESVRTALWTHRTLVRTWAMRGTLHLLPADELPTWVAALRVKERTIRRTRAWERYHGINVDQLGAITSAVGDVIGELPLTRAELGAKVAEATGDPRLADVVRTGFGGTILKSAAANGDLCFGPSQGRNVTFVDPKRWLPGPWREPDPAEATGLVVRRFLDAYGPATAADFARWWGVPPADGKKVLGPLHDELVEVDLEGQKTLVTAAGAEGLAAAEPLEGHVRLLPAFDTYVLSPHGHRRHTWPDGLHARISRTAGWITPTLLVDGRILGVWGQERRRGSVSLEIETFAPLSQPVRAAAEAQAGRFEAMLDTPIEVSWVERLRPPTASAGSLSR